MRSDGRRDDSRLPWVATERVCNCHVPLQVDGNREDRAKSRDATLLRKLLKELGKDDARRCREIARDPELADYASSP